MLIRVNCKNDKEVELIEREIANFKRRISRIKGKQLNYEAVTINLQNGKAKMIRNQRSKKEQTK